MVIVMSLRAGQAKKCPPCKSSMKKNKQRTMQKKRQPARATDCLCQVNPSQRCLARLRLQKVLIQHWFLLWLNALLLMLSSGHQHQAPRQTKKQRKMLLQPTPC